MLGGEKPAENENAISTFFLFPFHQDVEKITAKNLQLFFRTSCWNGNIRESQNCVFIFNLKTVTGKRRNGALRCSYERVACYLPWPSVRRGGCSPWGVGVRCDWSPGQRSVCRAPWRSNTVSSTKGKHPFYHSHADRPLCRHRSNNGASRSPKFVYNNYNLQISRFGTRISPIYEKVYIQNCFHCIRPTHPLLLNL